MRKRQCQCRIFWNSTVRPGIESEERSVNRICGWPMRLPRPARTSQWSDWQISSRAVMVKHERRTGRYIRNAIIAPRERDNEERQII